MREEEERRYNQIRVRGAVALLLVGVPLALAVDFAFPGLTVGPWRETVLGLAVVAQIAAIAVIPERLATWDMRARRRRDQRGTR
jgi:hypothetical protein